ncbi:hypothetical protein ACMFMG_001091 [Clarireedia jacksonii]
MTLPLTDKGRQLLGVLWMEVCLSIMFIGLRWYTRKFVGGAVGLDDWILLLSWFFMVGFAACISASVAHGMGTHASQLTVDDNANGILWLLIGQFLISIAMGTSKCAVAVFLIRIVNQLWHKIVLYIWIVTIMGLSFLLAISVFAQCTPVQSIWDPRIEGTCTLSLSIIAKIMCSWSAAMDFFLALFPWLILWKLNMKRKEKITICVSLSLGIIAGICGVVRTTTLDSLNETSDYLYAVSDSVMWTMSELTVTIVCVSIPALRPIYNRLTGGSSTGGPYQNYGDQKMNGTQGKDCDSKKSNHRNTVHKTANHYDVEIGHEETASADTDSDTFILHDMHGSSRKSANMDWKDSELSGGIRRQQDVAVTYDDGLSEVSGKQHV